MMLGIKVKPLIYTPFVCYGQTKFLHIMCVFGEQDLSLSVSMAVYVWSETFWDLSTCLGHMDFLFGRTTD